MANELFLLSLAVSFGGLLFWGFRVLPKENWQILAAVPLKKNEENTWKGLNLTYYGFFVALSYVLSTVILFILLGALFLSIPLLFLITISIAFLCIPAAKIMAVLVERKPHTLTIGGASFVGIILSPWVVYFIAREMESRFGFELPVLPILAALSIAYSYGEGLGRLACISFGCCYGKPLSRCHPVWRFLFQKHHFIFSGKTKKIAYADGLDQEPVIPIQAITSVIYVGSALLGTHFYLSGKFGLGFLITLLISQVWRSASEFLRADYRGEKRISIYQWMSLFSAGYGLFIFFCFREPQGPLPDILSGLAVLGSPVVFIFLQLFGLILFSFTGRSKVTGSTISIQVLKERI
jgi:hypothetical protein